MKFLRVRRIAAGAGLAMGLGVLPVGILLTTRLPRGDGDAALEAVILVAGLATGGAAGTVVTDAVSTLRQYGVFSRLFAWFISLSAALSVALAVWWVARGMIGLPPLNNGQLSTEIDEYAVLSVVALALLLSLPGRAERSPGWFASRGGARPITGFVAWFTCIFAVVLLVISALRSAR